MIRPTLAMLTLFAMPIFANGIPGLEPENNWDLDGYVKYMANVTLADNNQNITEHLIHQRFNFEYRFNDHLRFNSSLRNRLILGESTDIPGYADVIDTDTGYVDLSGNWLDKSGAIGNSQIDRLSLSWADEQWQVRGGRFRINWAMATLWNANDIFNSYSIYDFDYEERAGTDALMVSHTLGYASNIDIVYAPNSNRDLDSYSARYLFNHDLWDMQLLLGKSLSDRVIGAGFAGDIAGAGARGEVTFFDPIWETIPGQSQSSSVQKRTWVASLETDYTFNSSSNWAARAAILYISELQDINSGLHYLNMPLTPKTLSFAHWTYYADVGVDLTPLSRLTFAASYYQDGSYFVSATNSYSLANDWELLAVVQRFDGIKEESLFDSSAATQIFGRIKWSF
ncbi:hypothetical protein [Aliivibrio kagoshimensis]|uniref:hypothetical protein n=1 Tax=Aliivibrio kagoshimensis TaxID=2910230 RepID=UPI003D116EF5